jgi:uncharacterized protein (TIGR02266 family)
MNGPDSPGYTAEQKNQRRATRAPLIVEKIPCGDGQKTLFGYAKNISRGGLFIATVKPREPGEQFTIELTLPTNPRHTFRCLCEVVWKRHFQRKSSLEPGMGLKFIGLDNADGDKIDEWVSGLATRLTE